MRLFQGKAEGRGRILEGDVFSHLRVKLFDHGKLAMQGVVLNLHRSIDSCKTRAVSARFTLSAAHRVTSLKSNFMSYPMRTFVMTA